MCVGICVLLAIVYVLSRTGVNQDVMVDRNANMNNNGNAQTLRVNEPVNGVVPASTQPAVAVVSSSSDLNPTESAVASAAVPKEACDCPEPTIKTVYEPAPNTPTATTAAAGEDTAATDRVAAGPYRMRSSGGG